MNAKKNLCAMIPADLHAKVIAEKEQLAAYAGPKLHLDRW